jgi:hypothetical protein
MTIPMTPEKLKRAIGRLSIFGWKFPGHIQGEIPLVAVAPDGRIMDMQEAMATWEREDGGGEPFFELTKEELENPTPEVLAVMRSVQRIIGKTPPAAKKKPRRQTRRP